MHHNFYHKVLMLMQYHNKLQYMRCMMDLQLEVQKYIFNTEKDHSVHIVIGDHQHK